MAEVSPSIYQHLLNREVPLDVFGSMQQGQRSALNQMLLQEQRRQRQVEEQTRALYRQYYGQPVSGSSSLVPGSSSLVPGREPGTPNQGPGTIQETVNTPYSSDLQNMLSQYQQEGADVTPTPGPRTLPGVPGSGSVVSGSSSLVSGLEPGTMNQGPGTLNQGPRTGMASPHAGVDRAGLARALYQIDPAAGAAAEKAAVESQKAQLEMVGKQNAMVSQVARSILLADTQQAYETGVQYLTQLGIPTQHLPAIYDRRMVEHYYAMSTDAETRLKEAQGRLYGVQAELEPQKLAFEERKESRIGAHQETQEERLEKQRLETEQHHRAMEKIQRDANERGWTAEQRQEREAQERERHNRRLEDLQEGTAARGQTQQQAERENQLRDEYNTLSKDYRTQSDAYGRVQVSAKDPSAAGDLSMIFSYMKLLDPGSVVREGEQATAANARGIPDAIRNQYNRIMTGERLTDKQRADFTDRAQRLYDQATQDNARIRTQYEERAKRYGVDPRNVTTEFGSTARERLSEQDIADTIAASQQPGRTPKTRQQILDDARKAGMQVPEK